MIILLLSYFAVVQAYKLLKTLDLIVNRTFSGVLSFGQVDEHLLFVFEFVDGNYPIALVSFENIQESDFTRTVKPTFIESKKNVFFDYESVQIHFQTHIIEIPYGEQVYYFIKDGFGAFKVKINVYAKPQSTCTNNCQGYSIDENQMQSICKTQCECESGYFGSYCQFPKIEIEENQKMSFSLKPHSPIYLSFQFDKEAILIADDVIDPITTSFGMLGIKGYEVPDQTSYTAILHSQLSLTKLMLNLKQQFPTATVLIIGLQCRKEQDISLIIKLDQNSALWSGNCIFFIFACFNLIIILICSVITRLCKKDQQIQQKKRKIKVRPPQIDQKPKNFSGSFISKYFEIFDYTHFITINPQFNDQTQCVICMNELQIKEISLTPCDHLFHHACLKKWLMKTLTCPCCRFKIHYDIVLEGGWLGSKLGQHLKHSLLNNSKSELIIHNENCQDKENCPENGDCSIDNQEASQSND